MIRKGAVKVLLASQMPAYSAGWRPRGGGVPPVWGEVCAATAGGTGEGAGKGAGESAGGEAGATPKPPPPWVAVRRESTAADSAKRGSSAVTSGSSRSRAWRDMAHGMCKTACIGRTGVACTGENRPGAVQPMSRGCTTTQDGQHPDVSTRLPGQPVHPHPSPSPIRRCFGWAFLGPVGTPSDFPSKRALDGFLSPTRGLASHPNRGPFYTSPNAPNV